MSVKKLSKSLITIFILSIMMAVTVLSCSAEVHADERIIDGLEDSMGLINGVRPTSVSVHQVPRQDFHIYGEYYGEARGISEVALSAGIGGRVAELSAEEGELVEAGQSLGQIDPQRAEVLYQTALLNEEVAREALEREERFLQEGNSFQVRVDQARLQWLQAKASLLDAQLMREGALAITPISGTVVARHVELYDDLGPDEITFEVADLNQIRISVGVPEADMAGFQDDGAVEVRFNSFPDRVFHGQVVSYARTRSSMTLSYEVDVVVDNSEGLILPGQTARVRLALQSYDEVLVVPTPALFSKQGKNYVMVVSDDVAREQEVELGSGDNRLTIVTGGIAEGDQIVVEGFNRLSEGTPVNIVQTLSMVTEEI